MNKYQFVIMGFVVTIFDMIVMPALPAQMCEQRQTPDLGYNSTLKYESFGGIILDLDGCILVISS